MQRLTLITLIVFLTMSETAFSVNEDPLRAVTEQAAVLDAAPRLASGKLELNAEDLAKGAFVWLEVERDGLYWLTLSKPGALVLASFPTVDGRYDGKVKPGQHLKATSLTQVPKLEYMLLSPAHPYLLSASSDKGAGTLELTLIEAFPTLSETPARDGAVPAGDTLYAADSNLSLTVAGSTQARRIEVIAEPRAKLKARLGGVVVPSGGRYPWVTDEDTSLKITASSAKATAPPRVLVRVKPSDVVLDETEPNEKTPNELTVGAGFKGHLLQADQDQLVFNLASDEHLDLSVEVDAGGKFSIDLLRISGKEQTLILSREAGKDGFSENALALSAGRYWLVLKREDRNDAPLPYSVMLVGGIAPPPNQEVEPNDTQAAAMHLSESLRVTGTATAGDLDVFLFTVPDDKTDHLWRVFGMDTKRIQLKDDDGTIADVRATGRRSMADALALTPGDYAVTVYSDGDYLLRVMDLGPRPSDFEGEPNDSFADGQRLEFGAGVRGGFHQEKDLDYYLFRLDAASAINIDIKPTSDGPMDVKLYQGSSQSGDRIVFEAGDNPYKFQSNLPAGDWALAVRSLDYPIQENYEISVERLPALAGNEPDDNPLDARKIPRDGDFDGSVGAFDSTDQVFVSLPRGEGQAAIVCNRDTDQKTGRWRIHNWSDASTVADIRQGIAIFSYAPDLGGAVRLEMDGRERKVGYACAMRFPPTDSPPPVTPYSSIDEALSSDGELVLPLAKGETRRATVTAEGPEPRFALDLEDGEIAFVSCRTAAGGILEAKSRAWSLDRATLASKSLLGDLSPILTKSNPMIVLSRVYLQRSTDAALPLAVDCTLYAVDDLPRPADMGPPAEFRILEPEAPDSATESTAPPPPGLEALIARATPARQAEGDLPVAIQVEEPPELAAFSEAGQKFTVRATLTSEAATALSISVSFEVTGEGWFSNAEQTLITLAPGATSSVSAEIMAPPWLTPSLSPALIVRADSDVAFNATLTGLAISPSAVPLEPFTYWHAPLALRGGLNVLHYGLGARLIDWGGKVPDEKLQKGESGIHDGIAPHSSSINLPKEGITFQLAAISEVSGVMIQLRGTRRQNDWPAEVEVYAPEGDDDWQRIASSALKSIHEPQYLVFEEPISTDRLRFVFPRCNGTCKAPFVQEIQAISVPGKHPDSLPPINIAGPGLGGHVVWANHRFGGNWNNRLLTGSPSASNSGWAGSSKTPILQATIAFHQNRAALLQAVNWVGDPDDTERLTEALLEGSMEGPNGPWRSLGRLPAPPLGEDLSTLTFDSPVWARYLRVSFETPGRVTRYGPDAIEVIEVPGTSVLGLWEDDQPRAAYEATHNIQPAVPVPPAGGPSRESAVNLPLATPIASSVVIERNEDWWSFHVPDGVAHGLRLEFERKRPQVVAELSNANGESVPLETVSGEQILEAVLLPGEYVIRIYEPPRSVVISWDTSGSVAAYIPRTLAAVRTWGRSLQPGRDALQLLPFGPKGFLLEDWAETPQVLEPVLRNLPEEQSSASEEAMQKASGGLAGRHGARGIVIMTDAQTGMNPKLWPVMLKAMPRVVSLSVDSDSRQNAAIMMDWANVNHGLFKRVIGPLGLADGLDMANALFRAPKAYNLTATLEELIEPEGEATLTVSAFVDAATSVGAVELILDASGSMLKRLEGQRRIDIAHQALTGLVNNTLPEGTPFAFRAFGLEEDACRSDLIVPLGPLNHATATEAIAGVPAINLAKTAIADSLRAAAADLSDTVPPRVVVLVTDGEETCGGDPEAAIAELRESGLDARVNIVGFAIDDAALAETFASWAETGGGAYFDANGAEALERSIADALRPRFDITRTFLDGRTQVVGQAAMGEPLTVPAGRLTITPGSGASGASVTLQVQPQDDIAINYAPDTGLVVPDVAGTP